MSKVHKVHKVHKHVIYIESDRDLTVELYECLKLVTIQIPCIFSIGNVQESEWGTWKRKWAPVKGRKSK